MAGAGNIRAGGAYVEIFAKDTQFQQAMTRIQNKLKAVSASMRSIGTNLTLGGAAIGAPLILAIKGAQRFEKALLDARASAGLTAAEMEKVNAKALELSKAGVGGPGEIAEAFTALIKAGVPLEQALAGAGEAVVKFAANSGIETSRAAEIAADAMNVFGESTQSATDILKSAADSSSTDVDQMTQAFSQSSAVAAQSGQSMHSLSAALGLLASQGVKGSDAGTSLKTMLSRLKDGSDTATEALGEIGLSVESFRDSKGKMLPLAQIVDVLNGKLAGLDKIAKDNVMSRIFGTDAIRAASILTGVGSQGFADMAAKMAQSMTNAEAFDVKMSGVSGSLKRMSDGLERLQVAFTASLGDTMVYVEKGIIGLFDALAGLLTEFPVLGKTVAIVAGGLFGLGLAAIAGSMAFSVMAKGVGLLQGAVSILPALMSPVGLAIAGIGTAVVAAIAVARQLSPAFEAETNAIAAALMNGNISGAFSIISAQAQEAFLMVRQAGEMSFAGLSDMASTVGAFIGDKLIEGLDRFMGLFGADIITLQTSLQRLGIYLRAAFDWDFAMNGMSAAIAKVDADAERARAESPTADSRAADRATKRQTAYGKRGESLEEMYRRHEGERQLARARVEGEVGKVMFPGDTAEASPSIPRAQPDPFREPGVAAAAAAAGMAAKTAGSAAGGAGGSGVGQTSGTFSSRGEGLGISSELNKLAGSGAISVVPAVQGLQQAAFVGGGAVAASNAAGNLPGSAAKAMAGLDASTGGRSIDQVMNNGFTRMVEAIHEHTKVSKENGGRLDKIHDAIKSGGLAFT